MSGDKKKKEIPANLAESGISSVKHLEHIRQLLLKYTLSAYKSNYTTTAQLSESIIRQIQGNCVCDKWLIFDLWEHAIQGGVMQ